MLVSHRHQFIYTKTKKTAGTSVEIYFEDACLPLSHGLERLGPTETIITPSGIIGHRGRTVDHMWFNHMSAKLILEYIGTETWNRYFKFCVIRNPFDKIVSFWWGNMGPDNRQYYKDKDFSAIKRDFLAQLGEIASLIVDRDTYLIDGSVCVDFFIRHERLLEGLSHVCQKIEYPFRPEKLGQYKTNRRQSNRRFTDYYDNAAVNIVKSLFSWELEYFNYDILD